MVERMQARAGFTLIEMSIVLVLIGLVIGGVLKGQQLIDSARLKTTVSQWEAIRAGFTAFQDRYNALPGDYDLAATYITGAGVTNGNGDGVIGTADLSMESAYTAESSQAWEHLTYANYISGVRLDAGSTEDLSILPARMSGINLTIIHGTFGTTAGTGHWLRLQDTASGAPSRNALSGVEALEVDTRYDDGNADSGYIVMSTYSGTATGTADSCKTATGDYAGGGAQLCNAVMFLQ